MVACVLEKGFATRPTDESVGGLLLVGMNWGGGGGETETPALGEGTATGLFTDPANNYPFQRKLIRWFGLWGHPICPGNRLDRVISQTNLFLDESVHFATMERTEDDWAAATSRLGEVVCKLMPGGVLFFSIPTMRDAFSYASRKVVPSWQAAFGDILWADPIRFGRLKIQLPHSEPTRVRVAGVTHRCIRV